MSKEFSIHPGERGQAVPTFVLVMLFLTGGIITQARGGLSVTVVYDNVSLEEGLTADWGFSCVIQGAERTVLFDTGTRGAILLSNMEQLSVGPQDIDAIVISHEHGDHAGGLWDFLEHNRSVMLFIPASFSDDFKERARGYGVALVETGEQVELMSGIYVTGEPEGAVKEQSLVMRTADGLVVITGCAHPGIVDILAGVRKTFDDKIELVLGGFHLLNHSPQEVRTIVQEFRDLGVEKVGACHCTGEAAMELFAAEYGDDFITVGVGKRLTMGGVISE